jgi:prephenate dehydratase/chorismate mutase/prephenate dehydratase
VSVRVAFQGEPGAFSEEAARSYFGEGSVTVPQREFAGVGRVVMSGEVDYGILPVENSLAGPVTAARSVLAAHPFVVLGEVVHPIHLSLLALPGTALEEVRWILSHPVALRQCLRFLARHPAAEALATYDTAGAAKEVAALGERSRAAVAGQGAAARYGLVSLADRIEDRPDNRTRFVVVTRPGGARPGALESL